MMLRDTSVAVGCIYDHYNIILVEKSAGIVIVKLNHNDVRIFSILSVVSLGTGTLQD